jgi:drug/metabolite transporter (DMT)-like permease
MGGLVVLGGAFCWSKGSLVARYGTKPTSVAMGNGMQMVVGGAALVRVSLISGELGAIDPARESVALILAVFYLVVFGSLIGFSCYIWLRRNKTPAMASTHAYVNPAVVLFLGWALADEHLSPRTGIAAFVILSAVVVITTRRTGGGRPGRAGRRAGIGSHGGDGDRSEGVSVRAEGV